MMKNDDAFWFAKKLRDELSPGIVGYLENKREDVNDADLQASLEGDLILLVEHTDGKVTRHILASVDEIKSGAYKPLFRPRLMEWLQ